MEPDRWVISTADTAKYNAFYTAFLAAVNAAKCATVIGAVYTAKYTAFYDVFVGAFHAAKCSTIIAAADTTIPFPSRSQITVELTDWIKG